MVLLAKSFQDVCILKEFFNRMRPIFFSWDKIRFYHMNNSSEALGKDDIVPLLGQFVVILKDIPRISIANTLIRTNKQHWYWSLNYKCHK